MDLRRSTVTQRLPLTARKPFPFFSLPPEIRLRIYEYALIHASPCHTSHEYTLLLASYKKDDERPCSRPRRRYQSIPARNALALTCRQAYAEGIEIYYRNNLIQISYPLLPSFVTDIKPTHYRKIERLRLSRPMYTKFYMQTTSYILLLGNIDAVGLFQNLKYLQISGQNTTLHDLQHSPYSSLSVQQRPARGILKVAASLKNLKVIEWVSPRLWDPFLARQEEPDPPDIWAPWHYFITVYSLTHLAVERYMGLAGVDDNPRYCLYDGVFDNTVEYLEK